MAAERRISILIDTQGNPAGIDLVERRLSGLESSADSLFETLKMGVGIDLGGRLVSGLSQIPAAFERAIQRGVQFNAQIETATLGIAAILRQFDSTGRFKNFDDAMRASADAIELLKEKAKESPATFAELVSAFQGTAGAMAAANIPLERQVDLIVNMSQALSGLGIRSEQILQETRALITGNINADAAAAKILGITSAQVNAAKEQGQLYEFLSGKISAFAEAGARGAKTMNAALSNLEDAIDNVLAQVTKPIFEAMTKGTLDLKAALEDPAVVQSLETLGVHIADLVEAGYDLTQWAIENTDVLVFLAKAAAALGATFAAIKLANLIVDLGKKVIALRASAAAIEAETAALGRNTAAQLANNAARKGSVNMPKGYGRLGEDVAGEAARRAQETARRGWETGRGRDWTFSRPKWVDDAGASQARPAAGAARGAAGGMLSYSGVGANGAAAIAAPVAIAVTAAMAMWFIRQEKAARLEAQTRQNEEQSKAYGEATRGNLDAMNAMATAVDRGRVQLDIEKQILAVQEQRFQASLRGDAEGVRLAEQQQRFLEIQLSQVEKVFERVSATNRVEAARSAEMARQKALLEDMAKRREEQAENLPKLQARMEQLDPRSDAEKLEAARKERAVAPSEATMRNAERMAAALPYGSTDRKAAEASILEQKIRILELDKEIAELEEKIAASAQKSKDALDDVLEATEKALKARQDIASEVLIAEARARGEDDIADRLERQKKLREEIRRIVDATGVSEAEAERAARRLILAQEAAAKRGSGDGPVSKPSNPKPKRRFLDESYDEITKRMGGGETYDQRNTRMSGGRWTPPPAVQRLPSMGSVVPAGPRAPASSAAGEAPRGAGTRSASTETLYGLAKEAIAAIGTQREAEAAEALREYGEAMKELLAAGDQRYAELVAQLKVATQEIQGLRARANTKG